MMYCASQLFSELFMRSICAEIVNKIIYDDWEKLFLSFNFQLWKEMFWIWSANLILYIYFPSSPSSSSISVSASSNIPLPHRLKSSISQAKACDIPFCFHPPSLPFVWTILNVGTTYTTILFSIGSTCNYSFTISFWILSLLVISSFSMPVFCCSTDLEIMLLLFWLISLSSC